MRSIDGCCIWFYFITLLFIPHHCGRTCQVIKKQHATIICMFYFISLKLGMIHSISTWSPPSWVFWRQGMYQSHRNSCQGQIKNCEEKRFGARPNVVVICDERASQTLKVRTSKHGQWQFDNLYCKFVDSLVLLEHKELCFLLWMQNKEQAWRLMFYSFEFFRLNEIGWIKSRGIYKPL